jgi:hypothetical protein
MTSVIEFGDGTIIMDNWFLSEHFEYFALKLSGNWLKESNDFRIYSAKHFKEIVSNIKYLIPVSIGAYELMHFLNFSGYFGSYEVKEVKGKTEGMLNIFVDDNGKKCTMTDGDCHIPVYITDAENCTFKFTTGGSVHNLDARKYIELKKFVPGSHIGAYVNCTGTDCTYTIVSLSLGTYFPQVVITYKCIDHGRNEKRYIEVHMSLGK